MPQKVLILSHAPARAWDRLASLEGTAVTVVPEPAAAPVPLSDFDAIVVAGDCAGLDPVERIREDAGDVPVIVLAPSDESSFLEDVRRCGADAAFRDRGAPEKNAELALRAIEALRLSRDAQRLIQWSADLRASVARVARRNRALLRRAHALAAGADPFPVLLVDDDENSALLLARGFAAAGLPRFQRAVDGLEAIRYLAGEGDYAERKAYPVPALVILDYHMPRVNGLEVLRWMKRQPLLRSVPVVFLSFSDDPELVSEATGLGVNAYFVKPVALEQWTSVARLVLSYREVTLAAV